MAVYCADLLELRHFQHIRPRAGQGGLHRKVSWPFICVTPTISQWLHGGELLFFSGSNIQVDQRSLELLLRECIHQNLSGMVLLVGGESMLSISDELCRIADEADFPLFEMPWELRLIDVTQEIAELIVSRREAANQLRGFLEQAFFTEDDEHKPERLSNQYDIRTRQLAFVAFVTPHGEDAEDAELTQQLLHQFSFFQSGMALPRSTTLLATKHLESVVCLGMADTRAGGASLMELTEKLFRKLEEQAFPKAGLTLAFSTLSEATRIRALFREASKTADIMRHTGIRENVRSFRSLGICRLFFEISNTQSVREYCRESLEPLYRMDRETGSSLVDTLRCYLLHNGHLVKTAKELFIHRNTLLYRLGQIREALHVDLNDPYVRNEMFNSLLAVEMLFSGDQLFK